ncbi:hypothetical protein N0V90_006869 [Kalmusia sp. IMI 367209]|nr:hypothetical protein N0V90_006869 [Kalmusia sp. IMI 367209]
MSSQDVQVRLNEIKLERDFEESILNIGRALYGPKRYHYDFAVITSAEVNHDAAVGENDTVYKSLCIGYLDRDGGEWESLIESVAMHGTAWQALDELLRGIRYELQHATSKY